MNIQDVCEGKYLQLGALVAELNAHYDEGSNCREMNIQDVCEGKYFAARHTDGFWYRSGWPMSSTKRTLSSDMSTISGLVTLLVFNSTDFMYYDMRHFHVY